MNATNLKMNSKKQKEQSMNTDIQNKTTASEANSPQPTTNEEILSLLRKLVEQNETDKTNVSDKTEPSHGNAQDDNTVEIKRLLAELLEKQTNNAPATETVDNDLDDDFDDDDEIIADQDSDLETLGYIAGGAALVGLGALLYHWLKD